MFCAAHAKFDKVLNVKSGLKLFNNGKDSESVQFKFKLTSRGTISLVSGHCYNLPVYLLRDIKALINGPRWTPLKITIAGKRRMMQLWYMKQRGRMAKRGAAKPIKQLKNINAENELIVSFDQKNWKIQVNGVYVSDRFGSLAHNDSWKKVQRARGIANQPVRRFAITENMEIPQWKSINHDQCGYHYRLSGSTMNKLSYAMPKEISND